MNNLFSSILENIKQNYKEKADNTTDIAYRIEKIIGIAIPEQSIKVVNGVLYLNISPTIKSAIASQRTEILEALADFKIDTIR